nr:MAG TPA: HNH endonuclease bacteriophage, HNH Endonuclease, DNA.52A [Caudoviricetes sp.]
MDGKWQVYSKDISTTEIDGKVIIILSGETLQQLKELIASNNTHEFYVSPEWRHLRAEVLREQKNECQEHRKRGSYARANHVHHVNYLRNHPELALSKWYLDKLGILRRNLIAVCKDCHETVCHPERLRHAKLEPWPESWE